MTKKYTIKYYLTESAYKFGNAAYTETYTGDRYSAINWAQNRMKRSNYKYYELIES